MQPESPLDSKRALKVAIPRLERRPQSPPGGDKRNEKLKEQRVGKACTNCRKRKVKCSGETPRCNNCETNNIICVYDQARRDRLRSATSRNQSLVTLLNDLSLRVDDDDRRRIQEALAGIDDDLPDPVSLKSLGKRKELSRSDDGEQETPPGEALVPASVGSNEDLDILDEDLLRSREARETGYVGQNSEVQWFRSLHREVQNTDGQPYGLPYGTPGAGRAATVDRSEALHERRKSSKTQQMRAAVTESTFYLDNDDIELDIMVDPHELPPPDLAEKLFDCYMRSVHKSFPIIQNNLPDQFRRYNESVKKGTPFQVPDKWLAILNLVFAIGARYSHLIDANYAGEERDHLIYMTRSTRLLSLKDNVFSLAPDLGMIQATGLLSLYYLVIGHVSRAWVTVGLAIRLALSLGLHLRNEDPSLPSAKKETLIRTWWSLHSIECILSAITGRPCVLGHEDCTVALPHTEPEDLMRSRSPSMSPKHNRSRGGSRYRSPTRYSTSTAASDPVRRIGAPRCYLDAHIGIGLITQKLLTALYSPRTATRSWEYMQSTIPDLLDELEEWRQGALSDENGRLKTYPHPDGDRERILLQFYYYSTKILITRPCLCRTERRIKRQSKDSVNLNQKIAEACVQAAQGLAGLLPDAPNPVGLLENGPWWCITHYMMQAMAVMLLEMSYQHTHMTTHASTIIACVKKLVRWLRTMRKTDAVAERAYAVVVNILRHSGSQFRADVNELLTEDDASMEAERTASEAASPGHAEQVSTFGVVASGPPVPPTGWYTDQFATGSQTLPATIGGGVTPVPMDPQLYASLGQQDQYPFLMEPVTNPSAFSNPFITNFDQEIPFDMSMARWWPWQEQGAADGQQTYPYSMPPNQEFSSGGPQ